MSGEPSADAPAIRVAAANRRVEFHEDDSNAENLALHDGGRHTMRVVVEVEKPVGDPTMQSVTRVVRHHVKYLKLDDGWKFVEHSPEHVEVLGPESSEIMDPDDYELLLWARDHADRYMDDGDRPVLNPLRDAPGFDLPDPPEPTEEA